MATRTREQWNAEIDAYAAVAGMSSSAVADWKVLRDLCVSIAMFFETILDIFRTDVDYQLATKQFGTLYWYVAISKEFQAGDSLEVDNGIVKYNTIALDNRIVTQASAKEEEDGVLVLKVAKIVSGNLTALSSVELDDFRNYIAARKSPGVRISIFSEPPDSLEYQITGRFDQLYNKGEVEAGLYAALQYFRDNFRFDAVFYTSRLVQLLSEVPGVLSIELAVSLWDTLALTYNVIDVQEQLPAGYFNWSNSSVLNVLIPEN